MKEKSRFSKLISILFPSRRKTEPQIFYPLRFSFYSIAYIGIIFYIVYLIYKHITQSPQIEEYFDPNPNIYAPIVYLSAPFQFNVNCSYINSRAIKFGEDDCASSLTRVSTVKTEDYGIIFYNESLPLSANDFKNYPLGLSFDVYSIGEVTGFLTISVFHNSYVNEVSNIDGTKKNQDLQSRIIIRNYYESLHILSPNQRHFVSSRLLLASLPSLQNSSFYSHLEVYNSSSLEVVQKQVWGYDIPGIFSIIGGAWIFMMNVYVFLFGVDSRSPLGITQVILKSITGKEEVELNNERTKLLLEDYLIHVDEVVFPDSEENQHARIV
ncbi:18082_t:CDS:2 [Acaulospora morrowiae]|uniref:18082_t:CDS:1 n=1 Tax=Acaulospora morrowiae TaxID=94023 RepID=A0A9N8ZG94_9GLOM|nr:18082_t:CDS:2 [Acaulospora morrowiae]